MLENIWNLIVRYISKESSPEEEKKLDELKAHDEFVNQTLEESMEIWNKISPHYKEYNKDRIKQLRNNKIKAALKIKQQQQIVRLLKIAAIVTGFSFLLFFSYFDYKSTVTYTNQSNSIKKHILPDGSEVVLNKNAALTYSNSILRNFDRKVKLNGEAYFKISKTADKKQFTVFTRDFSIVVLGTQFNVRHDANYTSVMLAKGSVLLTDFSQKQIKNTILKVGELAIYNQEKQNLKIKKTNQIIHTAWLSDKLNFQDFNMQELAEMLQLLYNKKLIIQNKKLQNRRISGSAPSDDLDLVIEALKIILNAEIVEKQDSIIVK